MLRTLARHAVKPMESLACSRGPSRSVVLWRTKPTDTKPLIPLLDETQLFIPVLHRRHAVPLRKINGPHKKHRGRHHVFDEIVVPRQPMPDVEVILTQDVPGKGVAGTRLSLAGDKAYAEYLIAGYAVYATPENEARYQHLIEEAAQHRLFSTLTAQSTSFIIPQLMIYIPMNMKNSWTIERWHIRASLRQAGVFAAGDECIELPSKPISGPDPNKEGKHFISTVIINGKERAPILCRINHFINDEDLKLPIQPLFTPPYEPVFEEDKLLIEDYIRKRDATLQFKF